MLLIVQINELPSERFRLTVFLSANSYAKCNEISTALLCETRPHCSNRNIARRAPTTFDLDRLLIEKAKVANCFHDCSVTRVSQGLVVHRGNFSFVAESHRRQPARRMKR